MSKTGCWQPSEDCVFKLNVDGVLFIDLQEVGMDIILRDNKGEVILAASLRENNPKSRNHREFSYPQGPLTMLAYENSQTHYRV